MGHRWDTIPHICHRDYTHGQDQTPPVAQPPENPGKLEKLERLDSSDFPVYYLGWKRSPVEVRPGPTSSRADLVNRSPSTNQLSWDLVGETRNRPTRSCSDRAFQSGYPRSHGDHRTLRSICVRELGIRYRSPTSLVRLLAHLSHHYRCASGAQAGRYPGPADQRTVEVRCSDRDFLEGNALAGRDAAPRLGNTTKESRVVLESVFKPVIFRSKADQHAGRPPVPGNDDFLLLRRAEVSRQIILHLVQWNSPHRSWPTFLSDSSASPFRTTAST